MTVMKSSVLLHVMISQGLSEYNAGVMQMFALGRVMALLDSLTGQSSPEDSESLVPPVAPYPAAQDEPHGSARTETCRLTVTNYT